MTKLDKTRSKDFKRTVVFLSKEARAKLVKEQKRRKEQAPAGFKDIKISEVVEVAIRRAFR